MEALKLACKCNDHYPTPRGPVYNILMSLPPRWLGCPRKGKVVGGKFIPFKVPLSSQYDQYIPEGDKFDIPMLISYMEALQLRVGLVVDLTKTDRFYDKRSLTEKGIGHYKLKCEGFGEAPTPDQVEDFKRVCSHFFEQHPGEIIGVHCTHGYNRTGFLIICYLIEKEDWSFEAAVTAFNDSRPPGIYKPEYLQVLADRFNGGSMADIVVPARPAWCEEEATSEVGYVDDGTKLIRRKGRDKQNDHARFVDGITGPQYVGPPLREEIQQECMYILSFESSGFAGSQPVSMDVQNIRLLHEKPYRVSWKADGTRYMMYVRKKEEVFMLDRDNAVFIIPNLQFLSRKRAGEHLHQTLLDGEMVFDKISEENLKPRYLIYDIMQFEGNRDIAQCEHERRLFCINKEIIGPREEAAQNGLLDKTSEPFGVRAKEFWDVKDARKVLDIMKKLPHENDGLIFSPALDPYMPGQCNQLLKWKPSDLNSVDFRLTVVEKSQPGQIKERVGQLFVGGYSLPFAELDLKRNKDAKNYNGRIIECYWDNATGWNFMRVRDDKSYPNGLTTAKSVCRSINQPVTQSWLLEVIDHYRWRANKRPREQTISLSDDELMPPPKIIPRTTS